MNSRRCLIWLNKKRGSAESAGKLMNIQIFGTNKCFDTKKAMRYFKERGARYQFIDMKEKRREQRRVHEHKAGRGRY